MKVCIFCSNVLDSEKKKFCNSSCAAKHNNKIPKRKSKKLNAVCLNCDVQFSYLESCARGKFCSNKCGGEYRYKTISVTKIVKGICNNVGSLKRFLKETAGNVCVLCDQLPFHNGKELTLQLDHIDGNSDNNKIENLRLLCPNCHTQTDTWVSRNIKNTKRNGYLSRYKKHGSPSGYGTAFTQRQ
jgi:hypothetical protein